ncbi:MAG TPA: GTP 3',8-cyclase MoaA [Candidatus Paceibacterota bacterium]|nr:GTP 3',8-cyclase MoaA [Verrucomicrobiota bacterium]HSA10013.1 GTP 3',8-cyclase MoaA [Candidatus Paceibacterota bacterium]
MTGAGRLIDSQGRVLRDLRVSVTDRCNFRCLYCLPETEAARNFYRGHWANLPNPAPILQQWVPKTHILAFEEIERVIRLAVSLGIQKVRLTGGEPLLRHDVESLVGRVARIPGVGDLALTTNGMLFAQKGPALREAGLRRVSFSLDSLVRDNFRKITGRDGLEEVLGSISLAQELGLRPVKVNAVIIRGLNDHEIEGLAEFARERQLSLRFIEFMPLDSARAWLKEMVVPGHEVLARLRARFDLRPVASDNLSATAKRWAFPDGRGEVGIIAPVSEPFCGHCNRIRLTADGKVRTCLFSVTEHDLRSLLRGGASDEEIADWLKAVVWQKEARHHIGEPEFVPPPRSMSCIGG